VKLVAGNLRELRLAVELVQRIDDEPLESG